MADGVLSEEQLRNRSCNSSTDSVYIVDEDINTTRKSLFESAFKPKPVGADWKVHSARVAFMDFLPLQDLRFYPLRAALFLGTICYATMITIFAVFLIFGYLQALKEQFISLDSGSGRCSQVEKPVSGFFAASTSAVWEGTKSFYYRDAIYNFEFASYSGTDTQFYNDMMEFYETHIVKLGERAKQTSLSENMIAMMGFKGTIGSALNGLEYTHIFTFTANPATVFNKDYIFGAICSEVACCYQQSRVGYDDNNLIQAYSYKSYSNDPFCMTVDSPENLGYRRADDFSIHLNMASFSVALAINLQYLEDPSILEEIPQIFNVKIDYYNSVAFVDPRYKGMDPVYCFLPIDDSQGLKPFCWILMTHTNDSFPVYALPLINEYGGDECDCSAPDYDYYYYDDDDVDCNTFDFLSGLAYFSNDDPFSHYPSLQTMSLAYANDLGFQKLNEYALDALYHATGWPSSSEKNLFDSFFFCAVSESTTCNVMAFNSFDFDQNFVSEDYYQISEGNCNDTMTIEDFEKLANTPPTLLTEQYYKCYPTYWNAFFQSLGISFGNMSALAPIVLLIIIPIMSYLFFYCLDIPAPQKMYSDGEKSAAAKELALHLLRIKDGHHPDLKKDSILYALAEELKVLSKEYDDSNRIVQTKMRERASSLRGGPRPKRKSVEFEYPSV